LLAITGVGVAAAMVEQIAFDISLDLGRAIRVERVKANLPKGPEVIASLLGGRLRVGFCTFSGTKSGTKPVYLLAENGGIHGVF
jgi:hypothetical protein